MDPTYLPALVEYLERECKRLASENDLLRKAMLIHAAESVVMQAYFLASKTWLENGCPGPGDKTHDAMRAAFMEACAA